MSHSHQHAHLHNHARAGDYVGSSSRVSRTLADGASRVLVARATSTCTNDSDPGCTKPTQTPILAIVLGIAYVNTTLRP